MKLFKNLMHVCIFANDIEASIDFYKKLDCEVLFEIKMEPETEPWAYYLRLAQGQYIELQALDSAAPSPHPSPASVRAPADRSLWHFALETDDLRRVIAELRARGVTVWRDPEKSGTVEDFERDIHLGEDKCRIAWVIDPDGNPIELLEQVGCTPQRRFDHAD